eukprot:scaffold12515_cov56-Phaeocystis_antarctica.AAC.5
MSSCGSMYGAGLASPILLAALGCMKSRRLGTTAGSERDDTRCGPAADESRRTPHERTIARAHEARLRADAARSIDDELLADGGGTGPPIPEPPGTA